MIKRHEKSIKHPEEMNKHHGKIVERHEEMIKHHGKMIEHPGKINKHREKMIAFYRIKNFFFQVDLSIAFINFLIIRLLFR